MRQKSASPKVQVKVFGRPGSKPAPKHGAGIHPGLFYGLFAALCATNALTAVGFLMAPDISKLMSGQTDLVLGAYEDRIAQLRVEVDRLQSRQYAQAGDINLQMQELVQQQEVLLEQHQYVKQLAEKAVELGIETADLAPADDLAGDRLITGSIASKPSNSDIAAVGAAVDQMMDESRLALAAITEEATSSTDEILTELKGIGIRPKMPEGLESGIGGPFQPADDGPSATNLVDDANAVAEALARFKAAKGAIDLAPIHRPIATKRTSSGFGNRTDPFTRGKAFHSGLDFPAPTGTTVLSAGYGKVTFVGEKSGYGKLVEITHGAGLVTRYGHLSAFLVKEGQTVNTGSPIAKVGSTGRSTGPHLHFEVRRKDSAIDPSRFLAAGKRLQRFQGA